MESWWWKLNFVLFISSPKTTRFMAKRSSPMRALCLYFYIAFFLFEKIQSRLNQTCTLVSATIRQKLDIEPFILFVHFVFFHFSFQSTIKIFWRDSWFKIAFLIFRLNILLKKLTIHKTNQTNKQTINWPIGHLRPRLAAFLRAKLKISQTMLLFFNID